MQLSPKPARMWAGMNQTELVKTVILACQLVEKVEPCSIAGMDDGVFEQIKKLMSVK